MGQVKCPRQGLTRLRLDDKMDMIIHQAIGENLDAIFPAILVDVFQILNTIVISCKNILSIVAALSHMMQIPG